MTTKEQVLKILIQQNNQPISGQTIANQIEISRNAIWKAIESLREEGYVIKGIPQKGYLLQKTIQEIDPQLIKPHLPKEWQDLKVDFNPVTSSTNDLAKEFVIRHPNQQTLTITTKQTAGRGRYGRSFFSRLENGLYFTLAIQPSEQNPEVIPRYTLIAATAMLETLQTIVDEPEQLKVKWINDLFYKNRKVVGILSEVTTNLESFEISHVVIGIGLNLAGDFSTETALQNLAGTLFNQKLPLNFDYNELIIQFIKKFYQYHLEIDQSTFVSIYEKYLLNLHKSATYTDQTGKYTVKILGINPNGHLRVQYSDGSIGELFGPNVSFSSQQFIKD